MRSLAAFLVASACLLTAAVASANNGGVAGYTGKPTTFAPAGESCNQCHTGGATPTVSLTGPATMTANTEADFTMVVQTGLARAGGGVAATDGVVLTPGTGFRDSFGEMVQNGPQTLTGGQMTFRFKVKAPATNGTVMLWAVGLGANNSGSNAGDRAAHATKSITITGGTAPPPPPPPPGGGSSGTGSPGADAGSGTGPTGGATPGTPSGGGASTSGGTNDPDDPDSDGDDGTPGRRSAGQDGCSASPSHAAFDGALLAVGILAGLLLALRRSQRRTHRPRGGAKPLPRS